MALQLGKELTVRVISSNGVLYNGRASSVSSVNKIGPFDILGMHENFITLLRQKVRIIDISGKAHEFPCEQGLLEVSENNVRVFLGI